MFKPVWITAPAILGENPLLLCLGREDQGSAEGFVLLSSLPEAVPAEGSAGLAGTGTPQLQERQSSAAAALGLLLLPNTPKGGPEPPSPAGEGW